MKPQEAQSLHDRFHRVWDYLIPTANGVTDSTLSELVLDSHSVLTYEAFPMSPSEYYSDYEHRQGFRYRIVRASSMIHRANRRGIINCYIAGHLAYEYITGLPKCSLCGINPDEESILQHCGDYDGIPLFRSCKVPDSLLLCIYIPDLLTLDLASERANLNTLLSELDARKVRCIAIQQKKSCEPTEYLLDNKFIARRRPNGGWTLAGGCKAESVVYAGTVERLNRLEHESENCYIEDKHVFDSLEEIQRAVECGLFDIAHLVP